MLEFFDWMRCYSVDMCHVLWCVYRFSVTGVLWEINRFRWFIWCKRKPGQAVKQESELSVIWNAMTFRWHVTVGWNQQSLAWLTGTTVQVLNQTGTDVVWKQMYAVISNLRHSSKQCDYLYKFTRNHHTNILGWVLAYDHSHQKETEN